MSIKYIIADKNTGELHDNCGMCGMGSLPDRINFEANENALDDKHTIREVTFEERREIAGSLDENRRTFTKKLDLTKATKRLRDRADKSKSAVIAREKKEE